jgi:hypothetical protein
LPSEIQLQLPTLKKTNQEWKDLFSRYESVSKSANADSANAPPVGVGKLVFKAPKKFLPSSDDEIPPVFVPLELREIEMQAELATDEALWWMEDDDTSLLSSPLMQFLRDVRSFLILYWQWLIEPHEIASNCLGAIEDDMHQLKKYCEALADNLGRPVNIIDMDFPDVWCALDYLGSLVSSLSSHTDLKDIQASLSRMDSLIQHIQPMMTNLQDLNARFGLLEQNNKCVDDIVAQHKTRFRVIQLLLLQLPQHFTDFAALVTRVETLSSSLPTPPTPGLDSAPDPWIQVGPSPKFGPYGGCGITLNPIFIPP